MVNYDARLRSCRARTQERPSNLQEHGCREIGCVGHFRRRSPSTCPCQRRRTYPRNRLSRLSTCSMISQSFRDTLCCCSPGRSVARQTRTRPLCLLRRLHVPRCHLPRCHPELHTSPKWQQCYIDANRQRRITFPRVCVVELSHISPCASWGNPGTDRVSSWTSSSIDRSDMHAPDGRRATTRKKEAYSAASGDAARPWNRQQLSRQRWSSTKFIACGDGQN
jgi:hypothetical protein